MNSEIDIWEISGQVLGGSCAHGIASYWGNLQVKELTAYPTEHHMPSLEEPTCNAKAVPV